MRDQETPHAARNPGTARGVVWVCRYEDGAGEGAAVSALCVSAGWVKWASAKVMGVSRPLVDRTNLKQPTALFQVMFYTETSRASYFRRT